MVTVKQILEEVRTLTREERRQLREALDREEPMQGKLSGQLPNRALEQRWLAEHREEYLGEWVALQGDRLIAHGHDSREVYRAARSAGIGVPFVIRPRNLRRALNGRLAVNAA